MILPVSVLSRPVSLIPLLIPPLHLQAQAHQLAYNSVDSFIDSTSCFKANHCNIKVSELQQECRATLTASRKRTRRTAVAAYGSK